MNKKRDEQKKWKEKKEQILGLLKEDMELALAGSRSSTSEKEAGKIEEIYRNVERLVQGKDFYAPKLKIFGTDKLFSLHEWLFENLPSNSAQYKDSYPGVAQRKLKILKLIEEITPPPLEYLFSGKEIVTESSGELYINNYVGIRLRVWRPNQEQVWSGYGRYSTSYAHLNILPETYHIEALLFEKEGGLVIHNFNDDLPKQTNIVLGDNWATALKGEAAVFRAFCYQK